MAVTWTVTDLRPGRPFPLGLPNAEYPVVETSTGSYPTSAAASTSDLWGKLFRFTADGAHTNGGDVAATAVQLNGISCIAAICTPARKSDWTDAYTCEITPILGGFTVALGKNPNSAAALDTTHTDTVTDYTFDALIIGPASLDR